MSSPATRKPEPASSLSSYRDLYMASVMERIDLITRGVKASKAQHWLEMPTLGRNATLKALDLPVATFNRKLREKSRLSAMESERVVGFARLVGQVEAMVEEFGEPAGFDARAWLERWLTEPLPALGGARPIDFMNTMEGQNLVSEKLSQIASGAYA